MQLKRMTADLNSKIDSNTHTRTHTYTSQSVTHVVIVYQFYLHFRFLSGSVNVVVIHFNCVC